MLHIESSPDVRDLQQSFQVALAAFDQRGETARVYIAHASKMTAEMAVGDEIAEYGLIRAQAMEVGAVAKSEEEIYQ